MDAEDLTMATETFDNMVEIIDREMLVKGSYAGPIVNQSLLLGGAVCNGRRYCAIGSMVVAYGIKSHEKVDVDFHDMADEQGYKWARDFENLVLLARRRKTIAEYPVLQVVHDALNREAYDWIIAQGGEWDPDVDGWRIDLDEDNDAYVSAESTSAIEGLFESSEYFADTTNGRGILRSIVLRAKERILAGDLAETDWTVPAPVEV